MQIKKAEWIWLSKLPKSDEYVAFYDTFSIDENAKCKMLISVAGDYNVFINGVLVAFGQYPDFSYYKIYDEIDISAYLRKGQNEVLIIAWYIGKSFSTCRDYGAGLIYEVQDECGKELIYSKAGVCAALAQGYVSYQNKVITNQLGFSYKYDARCKPYIWGRAEKIQGFGFDLVKRPNKKLQLEELKAATLIDAEKQLYDLGEESCGFLAISFKAAKGNKLTIAFGEHIVDGGVRYSIDGRDFTVELIGNGEWVEFLGAFRRLGCRYLQIIEGQADIKYIGLREPNYPLQIKDYTIINKRRKQIYETSLKTLQLCLHEHYEDCPWREQSMYIMDSRNQMLCGYYAFDNFECAASAIKLIAAGQKENGLFELCFPADVPITIPSFSLAFTRMLVEYEQHTQDSVLVGSLLPNLEKMLAFFLSRIDCTGLFKTVNEDGIWHFYEWAGVLDGSFFADDGNEKKRNEYDVLINAFLLISLQDVVKLFALVGDTEKVTHYREVASKLKESIYQHFFDVGKGLFKTYGDSRKDYSELANALCILAEICDKNEAEYICEKLSGNYEGWTRNTLSMSIFKYDALLKTDNKKYAEFVLSDIENIYGYMLDNGATSFWETIKGDADFNLAGSLCHGWSALPIYYYWKLGVCTEDSAQ